MNDTTNTHEAVTAVIETIHANGMDSIDAECLIEEIQDAVFEYFNPEDQG